MHLPPHSPAAALDPKLHGSEGSDPVSGSSLRAPADVFLLGAGFSRAASTYMPLLQDLALRIRERFEPGARIPKEVTAIMQENFAHALSYLEQAKPWLTEAENLRHRALFLEFSSVIARDLDDTVRAIMRRPESSTPEWFTRLIRYWHDHRCMVLTLNYDTLVETVAASIEVQGGTTISSRDIYPPLLTDAALRSGLSPATKRLDTFRLLKLHGSTNWYYSGRTSAQGEPIYFVPPLGTRCVAPEKQEEHEHRLRAVADKYPFLIPPIYDKSALFTHETIRALWFEAGETLKRAKRLVCMGYSLPESDLTMKHFLRTSTSADATFEIVDPSEEAFSNFKRLLRGSPAKLQQSFAGPDCIQQFVEHLPQSPSGLARGPAEEAAPVSKC